MRATPRFMGVAEGRRLVYMLRHERTTGAIVQLLAAGSGAGTSSMVRDLALVAAEMAALRVLLLDLDPPGDGQASALRSLLAAPTADRSPLTPAPSEVALHQVTDSSLGGTLHVSEIRRPPAGGIAGWVALFGALRSAFDLVLVDSPSIDRAYDGVVLAPDVDTNLLVVEAERTRSPAACNLRDRILDVGGTIGGVVFNKRRFHIPGFIYRHV
jgi:Mrp family chromosome partitioning ATPase